MQWQADSYIFRNGMEIFNFLWDQYLPVNPTQKERPLGGSPI